MITWQLLIFFNIVLSSFSTLLQRVLMKDDKNDPAAVAIFFLLSSTVLVGFLLLLTGQFDFSGLSEILPNLFLLMILIGLFYLCLFRSLQTIDASEFIILLASRPFFTLVASTFLIGEVLTPSQIIGVLLIVGGVVLVSIKKTKINFGKGEKFALLAAMVLGFASTNDRVALARVSLPPYLLLSSILPAIFLLMTNRQKIPLLKNFFQKTIFLRMMIMTIVQFLSVASFLWALQVGDSSSQIVAISELNVITTVLLGIILLKERESLLRKIIAGLVSFAGLILVG